MASAEPCRIKTTFLIPVAQRANRWKDLDFERVRAFQSLISPCTRIIKHLTNIFRREALQKR